MILMVDNYDSFTYILVQYFRKLGVEMAVYRNDAITISEIEEMAPKAIIISPGPGNPDGAGITLSVISHFAGRLPLLGVCLGHQAIGQAFGGKVVRARRLMHGKTSLIHHDGRGLFSNMPQPFTATRYHSLILDPELLPGCMTVSAWTDQKEIMGVRHRTLPVEGVQFHPESILTQEGLRLINNFLFNYRIIYPAERSMESCNL
ncbi:MAG TPA: aminodeoxychorismate/anthranilate synthase component II [Candidatus Limnocylindrales bacterium]|nr:aminodeoxychorismate/anthranilate synthase component II [Candidatus Limnocylindrales bacterium]